MRVQPLIICFESPLQGYTFCVLIVLLLRLLWPPVDGKERAAIENNYLYQVYGAHYTYARSSILSRYGKKKRQLFLPFKQ